MSLGSFALDESVFAFTVTRCTSLACVAGIYKGGGGGGGRGFEQKKKQKPSLHKHRNTVNLNSHRSTKQNISEDGTDFTIQTAATR